MNAAVHRLENVGSDLRKIGSAFSGRFRLVNWLVFSAAREREQHTRDEIAADSSEAERLASGWEEYLHRPLIHICLVNLVARKILSAKERRGDNHSGKPGRSSGIVRPASTGDKTSDPASMNLVGLQRVTTKLSDDDQQTPA